jgi:hypothetical protein
MGPYQKREDSDRKQGSYHCHITENWFAGIDGHDFGYQAHGRQNDDVYLRVTQEPEEVLE